MSWIAGCVFSCIPAERRKALVALYGSVQADQIMEELEERWEEVRQSFGGDLQCIDAQVAHLTCSCS